MQRKARTPTPQPASHPGHGKPFTSAAAEDIPNSAEVSDMEEAIGGVSARLLDERLVPPTINSVSEVREWVADTAQRVGLNDEAVDSVRLAVGEAFVNAVKHGSQSDDQGEKKGPGTPINVRVLEQGDAIVIEIQDQGAGFKPDDIVLTQPGELKSCGRGIIFMRLFMDKVTFEFHNGGTLVRMTKNKKMKEDRSSDAGS